MTIKLKTGDLAYIDTLHNGLVPCKMIQMQPDTRQDGKPVVFKVARVTADRGPYKRGEVVTSEHAGHIVPREAVKRFRGRIFPRILPFEYVADALTGAA